GIVAAGAPGAGTPAAGRRGAAARRTARAAADLRIWPGARPERAAAPLMRAPYRVVVITGASSGLGAALALSYAGPQTALGLIGRNRERLAATASSCRASGAIVDSAEIDVTDGAALAAWLEAFDDTHPVELLVANAGISAGPDPFLASGGRAARRIKRGIDRGRARIDFPWPLVFGMRFCDLAPALIGDRIMRGFHFRIRSA